MFFFFYHETVLDFDTFFSVSILGHHVVSVLYSINEVYYNGSFSNV